MCKSCTFPCYLYTKNYTSNSSEFFEYASLSTLADILEQAKSIITEKIQ